MSTKKNIRVAIYTRCSTDEQFQGKAYSTLEAQEDRCLISIQDNLKNGWQHVKTYNDGGFSGGSTKRPALTDLLTDIQLGKIDIVLVYKLDRISRSISDLWDLIKSFDKYKVLFKSATEVFSTEDAMGRMMISLIAAFAQWERETTQERVKGKIASRARRGYVNGGMAAFGYDYDKSKKLLVINNEEAPWVKKIFQMAKAQKSNKEIVQFLDASGVRTKARTRTSRDNSDVTTQSGGKKWLPRNVARLLSKEIYKGVVAHDGNEYPGKHKAIVSAKLWGECNKPKAKLIPVEDDKLKLMQPNKNEALLKGILRCGGCGHLLIPKASGKKDPSGNPYLYYTCGNVNRYGKSGKCEVRNIPARGFETFMLELMSKIAKHPDLVKITTSAAVKAKQEEIKPFQDKAEKLNLELTEVSKKIAKLMKLITSDDMEDFSDSLRDEANSLGKKKTELQLEIDKANLEIQYRESVVTSEKVIAEKLSEFLSIFEELTFEEKHELMKHIFQEVTVSKFDPKKEKLADDVIPYCVKKRTQCYSLELKLFSKTLKIKGLRDNEDWLTEVRNLNESGGQ